jgi:hypothetical protein
MVRMRRFLVESGVFIISLSRPVCLEYSRLSVEYKESKHILGQFQQVVIQHQIAACLEQQRPCPACATPRRIKQQATAPFRTLFGRVAVANPRWYHCDGQPRSAKTLRPLTQLLPERTSPELRYLETSWASLVSYDLTARLLHEVLPIDATHSAVTVRNHLLQLAHRAEQRLGDNRVTVWDPCQAERDRLPIPDGPLAVELDGAIVRARRGSCGAQTANLFEVSAGNCELRGPVSAGRADQYGICRVDGQLRGEQTDGQETTNAVDARGRSSPPPSADPGAQ